MIPSFVVVCRSDNRDHSDGFEYVLATRRIFATQIDADRYASGISPGRYAKVMSLRDYMVSFEGWRHAE
jgi:hypothetical protein